MESSDTRSKVRLTNHLPSSPWIEIADKRIICVEHPAIIRNLQNAIPTLGGDEALSKFATSNGEIPLRLNFRPDDPMQPSIESVTVPTNNLLLKITIPRRRKKMSRQSGNDCNRPNARARNESLLDKIRASKGHYTIEAVGTIDKTVRFRDMANFQWNTSHSPFVAKMKDCILSCNFDDIKRFQLGTEKGQTDPEILPPPAFSNTYVPHTYNYRQNPAVKRALIDGKTALLNFQAAPKTLTPMVHGSIAEIPTKPASVPEYEQLDSPEKESVDHLRRLFETRPIWTRRALYNNFPKHLQTLVRFTMAHVAYMWRAGPWRDTCVLYGVDPRSDVKYRIYQSVFFQIETSKSRTAYQSTNIENSHIFDGQRLVRDGRCFQLCDVTDPLLQQLINTPNLRKNWDTQDGWYRYSTLSKIKAVMKAKITGLAEGKPVKDSDYIPILEQESEEEEEEEEARKVKDAKEKDQRSEKRRIGLRNVRHSLQAEKGSAVSSGGVPVEIEEQANNGAEDEEAEEEEEEEEGNGEWEQELELPVSQKQIDERVQNIMVEFMNHVDPGFDEEDDKGDFNLLEANDGDGVE